MGGLQGGRCPPARGGKQLCCDSHSLSLRGQPGCRLILSVITTLTCASQHHHFILGSDPRREERLRLAVPVPLGS